MAAERSPFSEVPPKIVNLEVGLAVCLRLTRMQTSALGGSVIGYLTTVGPRGKDPSKPSASGRGNTSASPTQGRRAVYSNLLKTGKFECHRALKSARSIAAVSS